MEIEKIWLTKDAVWIRAKDGREACERFVDYPRLRSASAKQRANYEADEYGIHWPDLDEDLSFEGFFREKPRTELYRFFELHPELNASAVARRMGISQSLFAQYISGIKKPSLRRMAQIYSTLQGIGKELLEDPLVARDVKDR
jgi:transcriptional regulator with XRE-family HTH domain